MEQTDGTAAQAGMVTDDRRRLGREVLFPSTCGIPVAVLEDGETVRIFEIAPTAARKLPKDMIGRVLHGAEVERLMKIIANDDRGRSRPRKHFRP